VFCKEEKKLTNLHVVSIAREVGDIDPFVHILEEMVHDTVQVHLENAGPLREGEGVGAIVPEHFHGVVELRVFVPNVLEVSSPMPTYRGEESVQQKTMKTTEREARS